MAAVPWAAPANAGANIAATDCGSIIRLAAGHADCDQKVRAGGGIRGTSSYRSNEITPVQSLRRVDLPAVAVEEGSDGGNSLRVYCGGRVQLISGTPSNVCN